MCDLKTRFGIMMFLQYAIWGSWTTALGAHLEKIGFSGSEIAGIYGCMWLACIVAPFIGGQVADRLMQSQQFLGIAHIVGAFLLYQTSIQTEFMLKNDFSIKDIICHLEEILGFGFFNKNAQKKLKIYQSKISG